MIGKIETGTLASSMISATISQGFSAQTRDGRPAQLAIIDEFGNVIEIGDQVAREAFNVAVASYKNFLKGQGHLRVYGAAEIAAKNREGKEWSNSDA
jgi:hypothetical protein